MFKHCHSCGGVLKGEENVWPKRCTVCHKEIFKNPLPVAIAIQPVDDGILLVRRGIKPQKGFWCLPCGYINDRETWQEGAVREMYEEAMVIADPLAATLLGVESSFNREHLIFIVLFPWISSESLLPFKKNFEVTERMIGVEPLELAFPLHTKFYQEFLTHRKK